MAVRVEDDVRVVGVTNPTFGTTARARDFLARVPSVVGEREPKDSAMYLRLEQVCWWLDHVLPFAETDPNYPGWYMVNAREELERARACLAEAPHRVDARVTVVEALREARSYLRQCDHSNDSDGDWEHVVAHVERALGLLARVPSVVGERSQDDLLRAIESALFTVACQRGRGEKVSDQAESLAVLRAVKRVSVGERTESKKP